MSASRRDFKGPGGLSKPSSPRAGPPAEASLLHCSAIDRFDLQMLCSIYPCKHERTFDLVALQGQLLHQSAWSGDFQAEKLAMSAARCEGGTTNLRPGRSMQLDVRSVLRLALSRRYRMPIVGKSVQSSRTGTRARRCNDTHSTLLSALCPTLRVRPPPISHDVKC